MAASSQRAARLQHAAGDRDHRAQRQRHADEQHADERDVRVGVGHAVEDRVLLEEQIEAADVLANGQREKQKAGGDGDAAPGQGSGAAKAPAERAPAAGGDEEEHGENADDAPRASAAIRRSAAMPAA